MKAIIIHAILMLAVFLSGCSEPTDEFRIGVVTDVGQINDRGFNQAAWTGVRAAAQQMGLGYKDYRYVETKEGKDYKNNVRQFAAGGYDVIVTVGFALGEATRDLALEYPNSKFIGVDQFQTETITNMVGIIFHEDKAGYLAGALAAHMTRTNVIAAVLGTNLVPPVVAFKEGYEAGANAVKPGIKVISIYHPGSLDAAFADPKWGAETAAKAIDEGADVIFGAGGLTGNGAIEEAAARGVMCIGVDMDQWETLPAARPCLLSSATKQIAFTVHQLIRKAKDGELPSGNYYGDVGLAPYHDMEEKIPKDVKRDLIRIKFGLMDGRISTGYNPHLGK